MHRYANELGEPDLALGGVQLWLHSHDAEEDWLTLTAHCGTEGASVWASGTFLQLSDIVRFGEQCAALEAEHADQAILESYENDLRVELQRPGARGDIRMVIQITPNPITQEHRFWREIDLSYLPELRRRIGQISARFRRDRA